MKKAVMVFAFTLVIMAVLSVNSFAATGDVIDLRPFLPVNFSSSSFNSDYDRSTFTLVNTFKGNSDKYLYHSFASGLASNYPSLVVGERYILRVSGSIPTGTYSDIIFYFHVNKVVSFSLPHDKQYFTVNGSSFSFVYDFVATTNTVAWLDSLTFWTTTASKTQTLTYSEFSIQKFISSYTLTPNAGTGGGISPSTAQTVDAGGSQIFTVTPDSGYRIKDVKVDGVSVGAVSSYTFSDVQADSTITVEFEAIPKYTLTPSAGAGGGISPSPAQTVEQGGSRTFIITPNEGHVIKDVLVNGVSVGVIDSYTFNNVAANASIHAEFYELPPPPKYYTVIPIAGEGGNISPNTPQSVLEGSSQSFYIAPDDGYLTADVLVNGASVGAVGSYVFHEITADATIEAVFASLPPPPPTYYTITPSAGYGGSISPSAAQSVIQGGSHAFHITPDNGYRISDVSVNGVSVGAVDYFNFTNVNSNFSIRALFSPVEHPPPEPGDGYFGFSNAESVAKYSGFKAESVLNFGVSVRQSIGAIVNIGFVLFFIVSCLYIARQMIFAVIDLWR